MWITRIRPVSALPGATPGDDAPTPAGTVVTGIEIEGMGYLDRIGTSEKIGEFRDQLRASPLFSDQTEITWRPPVRPDASTLEFKILARLEEPQEL